MFSKSIITGGGFLVKLFGSIRKTKNNDVMFCCFMSLCLCWNLEVVVVVEVERERERESFQVVG